MEEQVQRLTEKAWRKYNDLPADRRVLIAVSGIPGSGKSTIAATVAARLNARAGAGAVAVHVPMDGYHLTRAELSAMPNPEDAHFRRGAAFTFNAAAFLKLLGRVREPLTEATTTILAPSFDHAIKDPVEDDIPIPAEARIVIFEGNYLSLAKGEWKEIGNLVDERWFVEVGEDTAKERLARRHAEAGIVKDEKEGIYRAENLDLVNGREIIANRGPVDEVIFSKEDECWKG